MKLLSALLFTIVAGACGTTDDRPETLAYITETILTPYCGTSTCHSAMKKEAGYVFDSVEAAQASIASYPLIEVCATPPCAVDESTSYLIQVISRRDDSAGNRMPIDQPLPNLDMVLIANWIRDGAAGYTPPSGN